MRTRGIPLRPHLTRFIALVVMCALVPMSYPPATTAAGPFVVSDTFTRSVASGWGSADTGGTYTLDGTAANFAVDGSKASITLPKAGANRAGFLPTVAARDVDVTMRVTAGRPQGGSLFVYALVRRNGNNEYRPKLVLNPNGSVAVHAGLVQNGTESAMGSQVVVSGLTQSVGTFIWLRAQVTGASPTTIRVKAWADGTTEPATWAYTATNSVAAVQGVGSFGLRAYANSTVTNAPLTVSFDDLTVESLDSPPAPVADFNWSQTADPLTYSFTDESTGGPTEWLWDFGDGDTSIEQSPTHPYLVEGSYTVTLTATNAVDSDSISHQVDVQATPPGPTVVASDAFARTKADSWGVADTGGLYSYNGRLIDFDVNGSQGALHLPSAGQTRSIFLLDALAHDTEMSFSVSPTKVAAGSSFYVYSTLRRTTDGSAYRPKVRFAPGGQVFVHAGRLISGTETSLGPEVRVTGLSYAADSVVWLRARVTGSNPTTIQVRAWADGQLEPTTWQFSATDSTAALQSAGAVGVVTYLSSGSTNVPLVVRIDDLLVTTTDPIAARPGRDLRRRRRHRGLQRQRRRGHRGVARPNLRHRVHGRRQRLSQRQRPRFQHLLRANMGPPQGAYLSDARQSRVQLVLDRRLRTSTISARSPESAARAGTPMTSALGASTCSTRTAVSSAVP